MSGETEEGRGKERRRRRRKRREATADQLLPLNNQHIAFKSTHIKASVLDSMNSTGGCRGCLFQTEPVG